MEAKTEGIEERQWREGWGKGDYLREAINRENTVYMFCFILLFTFSSPCRKDQFAVSYFSTSLIVLNHRPGLQLGDPAPLIGLLLWTC